MNAVKVSASLNTFDKMHTIIVRSSVWCVISKTWWCQKNNQLQAINIVYMQF